MEPIDVRLARVEEKLTALHKESKRNHEEVMDALDPVLHHSRDIAMLKRDRFWLFTLVSFFSLTAAQYLFERFKR